MKSLDVHISSYVGIKQNKLCLDGDVIFEVDTTKSLAQFLKDTYMFLGIDYPKFYKMDNLCKLGFLGAEIIDKNQSLHTNTALVFANSSSSLDTDRKHQAAINDDGFVSPATFVYTLPNIILGELSIRHHLQSENMFFITPTFDANTLVEYTKALMQEQSAEHYLLGWIDVDYMSYTAFLCLISQGGKFPLNVTNLNKAFRNLL